MSWRKGDTPEDRFWRKVDKSGDCWGWTGSTNAGGYGMFHAVGKMAKAHRFSYEIANGPIPEGMLIDHKCYNASCVNPSHLRLVTPKQNSENRRGASSVTRSGFRGVSWHKRSQRWQAQVGHLGEVHFVGYFTDPAEAGAAAEAKRLELFTHNDVDRRNAA